MECGLDMVQTLETQALLLSLLAQQLANMKIQLYAQIIHGAPFQVFLAADQERPLRLVSEGFAERGSQLTYALGRIVLYCPRKGSDQQPVEVLKSNGFTRLAIANPKTAPYGRAALEVLQKLPLSPLHLYQELVLVWKYRQAEDTRRRRQ